MKSKIKTILFLPSVLFLTSCSLNANIQAIKSAGLGSYKITETGTERYSVSGKGITFDVIKNSNGDYVDNYESNLLEFYLMEYQEAGYELPLDIIEYKEDELEQASLELHYSNLDELNEKEDSLKEFIKFSDATFGTKITYVYDTQVDNIEDFVETTNEFKIYKRDIKEVKQTFADAQYFLENGTYLNEVSYGGLYNLLVENGFDVEGDCYHFKYTFNGDTYEFGYDLGYKYFKNGNIVNCRKRLNYFNVGEVSGIEHKTD